jgi:hypothetical protein|eukprot:COSAG01_NODE_4737_length_4782_cov_250.910527_4_plen_267_part_00
MVRLSTSLRELDATSIRAMKVVQLRAELSSRGLPTKGLKSALISRLTDSLTAVADASAPAPAAVLSELPVRTDIFKIPAIPDRAKRKLDNSPQQRRLGGLVPCPDTQSADKENSSEGDGGAADNWLPFVVTERRQRGSTSPLLLSAYSSPYSAVDTAAQQKITALEMAMEETLADMEKLDEQLAASQAQSKQLEDALVAAREESAYVWGTSQRLHETTKQCATELMQERDRRKHAEAELRAARACNTDMYRQLKPHRRCELAHACV